MIENYYYPSPDNSDSEERDVREKGASHANTSWNCRPPKTLSQSSFLGLTSSDHQNGEAKVEILNYSEMTQK
jgi:hypothetical protein